MTSAEGSTESLEDPSSGKVPEVAAVIPAYQEAGHIGQVLEVLLNCPFLSEIVVVDDGSQDTTAQESIRAAQPDPRFRLIRHPINRGKGAALLTGWQSIRAPYMLFLDADLIHLEPRHIADLVRPVIQNEADMTVGVFRGGYWRTDYAHILTPWLSGQRCIRRELLRQIPWEKAAGYGFETVLTITARKNRWRKKHVVMQGVTHLLGEEADGGHRGWYHKYVMYRQILETWFEIGEWRTLVPRLTRQLRLGVLLMFAFILSSFNSCAVSASNVQSRILMRWLNANLDQLWLWWGNLRITIDVLQ